MIRHIRPALTAAAAAVLLVLTGCASNDSLAEQYRAGQNKGYIAGDGTITEYPPAQRPDPVAFGGELDTGTRFTSDELNGAVLVVNFWYAGCAPCRAEAPDLQALADEFAEQDVQFVGVNVRDQAATARAFADTYGITYPSILDILDGKTSLAFAGDVPPAAVPTTLVLDREHRVAARLLGQIPSRGTLRAIIRAVVQEPGSTGASQ